jgi:Di-haem oxidoreductase, putative peroxidase
MVISLGLTLSAASTASAQTQDRSTIGLEVSTPKHLLDGQEYHLPIPKLIEHGRKLFVAVWTSQEGGGRPLTKGTGAPLSDLSDPLVFPRNFNRISAPDSNGCSGCHNAPMGIPGGGGDIVGNVFVLGQRFDFATFDMLSQIPTKSSVDELARPVSMNNVADSRATIGMFGSGYLEMVARQMTADLQSIRDQTPPNGARLLVSKGISFGTIRRAADGSWDTSQVEGIPDSSLATSGPDQPPNLILRPFHQAGRVVSLREFSNNALNHHHGIQSEERFGLNTDPDGDGFMNELTRADMTAVTVFQATMAVPGRVIPNDPAVESAVLTGESAFESVGCAQCHVPSLPLDRQGWIYTEPNPFNPPGNLQVGDAPTLSVDLNGDNLPSPRLKPEAHGVVYVPAYTDLKLHDLTDGPNDPNREPLDMQQAAGSMGFFEGNGKFITKKLWGAANEPPYFHHGKFTTMREAIWAHGGEAALVRQAFLNLSPYEQDCIIEFLKTLQVLPPGTKHLVVDENFRPKSWPPAGHGRGKQRAGR